MNPEIRFRVPSEIHQLAEEKAGQLGLEETGGRGRSSAVSRLARACLYASLGLASPEDAHLAQAQHFSQLRSTREKLEGEEPRVQIQVRHRVENRLRRRSVLEQGHPIPAIVTTVFVFPLGSVPPEIVARVQLSDRGIPYSQMDLTRDPDALVSGAPEATLEEVLTVLQRREKRLAESTERERQAEHGEQVLHAWALQHGSELLKARIEEGFEWLHLARQEHSENRLRQLGFEELEPIAVSQTLAKGPLDNDVSVSRERQPGLQEIRQLRELRARVSTHPDIKVRLVRVKRKGQHTTAGALIAFRCPDSTPAHFLTPLDS